MPESVFRNLSSVLDVSNILIVSEDIYAQARVGKTLSAGGLECLKFVDSFETASTAIDEEMPDLVILNNDFTVDVIIELCQQLKSILDDNIPVVCYLPRHDQDARLEAFKSGVTEIIIQPSSDGEFILRIRRALERRNLLKQLRRDKVRFQKDLVAAQNMQCDLLQSKETIDAISETRNVEIDTFYEASNMLGGDWWHVMPIDNDRVGLLTFDISGHGVTAAINAFRLQLIILSLKEERRRPAIWMSLLNKELYKILPPEQFASGFYGVYHRRKHELEYVNAGSPTPFVFRDRKSGFDKLQTTGPILGCASEINYESKIEVLAPNDRLFLYSDALYEDFEHPENTLGTDELGELLLKISENQHTGPAFIEAVFEKMVQRTNNKKFDDDLTILSMKVLPPKDMRSYYRTSAVKNCVWIASPSSHVVTEELIEYLYGEYGSSLHVGDKLPAGSEVDFVIVAETHIDRLKLARDHSTEFFSSILISSDRCHDEIADFVLPMDTDFETLKSVSKACRELRLQSHSLREEVSLRKSAIGTINNGEFSFSTLTEARNLSTMLAIACPNADMVAIGLRELMVNAVEHGNLEISSQQKQDLIMSGNWRNEIETRLQDPRYSEREVVIRYSRTAEQITFLIEDEGSGFDFAALDKEQPTGTTYRGRGIALARQLAFPEIEYLGCGNIVRAVINLN
ncbi:ATP-binding SpoIIE family protein phosphatase [Hirschia baltica]|uniref:Response regulator receiver modulated serine phosphatase n=1 Tax=Hirschia baltica (strain ATCC 49814 / DSM 5838 / IFAM 1418) TaxID=582402 RepID=C6XM12_HIRBI|nr:SpoIIE family protein phosphatase [Hirschia baltica]ACT59844.1 response regulator receiver modulated serine phosphatase [Hirschia baltica ATCC 49814]